MRTSPEKTINFNTIKRVRARRKQQSGQSLLIALAVLFLLGFLGALFASIVVRNLSNAQSANETINTDYFAQAGINYANTMLQTSPLGADWRPPLQYTDSTQSAPSAAATALGPPLVEDPDYKWLNAGYTRYNMSGGRFLLKVTYNPDQSGTNSSYSPNQNKKYIQIDSIGRIGVVDANDPTTFTQDPPDLRRSELTAYKPIGIVDYSRFITNKDSRTDTANLGVPSETSPATATGINYSGAVYTPGVVDFNPSSLPAADPYTPTAYPLVTTYGSTTDYSAVSATSGTAYNALGGGSLRSNMNLRLYGENNVYLNTTFGDDWEVAGNLTFDNYNSTTAGTAYGSLQAQCTLYAPDATTATVTDNYPVYPSNSVGTGVSFDTYYGAIRDGSTSSDVNGSPRSIKRLNPPLIDTIDSATGLTRYQTLTSGGEVQTQQYATTADYIPATVYINNASDIQTESVNQVHGYTLRSDWLNHTADTGGSWEGSYYNPPGALITFGPLSGVTTSTGGATQPYGITLTRSDKDGNGAPVAWTTTSGTTTTPISSETLKLLYQPLPSTTSNPDTNGIGYLQSSTESASDPTNVVIYASGNVRVRGILSSAAGPAVHITVVTNGIAYIDGSVLKGNPASSIAILAKSYVCLNTTQFLAGAADLNTSVTSVASSVGPPPALTFSNAESIDEEGLYETPTASQLVNPSTTYAYRLYLSQSSGGTNLQSSGLINNMQLSGYVDSPYNSSDLVTGTTPVRDVISLPATVGGATIAAPVSDTPFTLTFSKDPQYTSDWLVQKAAILPGDVQIQAVLYAQDDSFFVIPGDWFNTDSADTLTHAFDRLTSDPLTRDPRYPFYGQPIDLQITINGAVSENVPADISDQAAWMQKWGWIPVYHGLVPGTGGAVTMAAQDQSPHSLTPTIGVSANVPQIGIGLNLSYDHTVGFPYILNGTGSTATITYLRQDRFGRPLPFAPALPVSPDLLYSGRPTS